MPRLARSLALALLALAVCAATAGAVTLKSIGEFTQPIYVTSDPGNASRLFVVEREGRVQEVLDGGAPKLFADLTALAKCCEGERGLLSIALAPDFDSSGRFYADYAGKAAAGGSVGDIHVDSFVTEGPADITRTPLLTIGHNQQSNHNGGQLQFGPDGDLYISVGDGGGGGDPFLSGQNTDALLGKILRIDPEPGSAPPAPPYSIPAGNPFASTPGKAEQIWAYGLRNPWRFSFDSLTGDMVIGDVGQDAHEEVDFAPSPAAGVVGGGGANYGWSCREGFFPYTDSSPTPNCEGVTFTEPAFDYPHSGAEAGRAQGCAITGGYVVRDPGLGALDGRYLYADYCGGEIRSLQLPAAAGGRATDDRSEGIDISGPDSFGEDSCHRLYVISGSEVLRFEGATPTECPPPDEEEPLGEEEPGEEEEEPGGEEEGEHVGPPVRVPPAEGKLVAGPPAPTPEVAETPRRLSIVSGRRTPRGIRVVVEIRPCLTDADRDYTIRLKVGGRPVGHGEAPGRGCRTAFVVGDVSSTTSVRALAFPNAGGPPLRSKEGRLIPPAQGA